VSDDFKQDVFLNKPGIVGARWWNQGLLDDESRMSRREALVGMAVLGGSAVAVLAGFGALVAAISGDSESTSLDERTALDMQKRFGWDFGARGSTLVFDGQSHTPFVREDLAKLPGIMAPLPGPFAKHYIPTLVDSILASPFATLPDPQDGLTRPDAGTFRRLADVLVPIVTPKMQAAYTAGEALARLAAGRAGLAVLVDLPGPESIAFAAGAVSAFEPILLLDNWPHPYGVVPSHLTLAAMAYYQPRFAWRHERGHGQPLFVLDRTRVAPYVESSTRFDNRYHARMPSLQNLAKDGAKTFLYVAESPEALKEPDDLNRVLSVTQADAKLERRAAALADLASEAAFWTSPRDHTFSPRPYMSLARVGMVPVVVAASGVILSAALDRFSGGWSG
jgi:hypothetical protein